MLIAWLDDPAARTHDLTGGKAANLSRLAADHPVPPGFCVTTEAYAAWCRASRPATLPARIGAQLAAARRQLVEPGGSATGHLAVRSSAVGEDSHGASYAGQYSTFLNVAADELAATVVRCWESAEGAMVEAYRRRAPAEGPRPVAVLVQQLVAADVAFVAFSTHPVTGDQTEVVVDASWGLGASIVDATVTPDTYHVRKSDGAVTDRQVNDKARMTVLRPIGVVEVKVPRALRRRPALTTDQARSIARLATRLEVEMGWPVDVEGAIDGDGLHLLQCRPISTVGNRA